MNKDKGCGERIYKAVDKDKGNEERIFKTANEDKKRKEEMKMEEMKRGFVIQSGKRKELNGVT